MRKIGFKWQKNAPFLGEKRMRQNFRQNLGKSDKIWAKLKRNLGKSDKI